MIGSEYVKMLVEEMHSSAVATIGNDGHPQIRIIDMMYYDDNGVYFLTAQGKEFHRQLMEQKYIALSAVKDKRSISLRGTIRNMHNEKLDLLFEGNPYMKEIYPDDTRDILDVFCLYDGMGEYFDISDPSHIIRDTISFSDKDSVETGYFVNERCDGCGICASVCPQKCMDVSNTPAVIDQSHCLHCGRCVKYCPKHCIVHRR